MKRICKQCGKEFELVESELNFYRKKNLAFPKRCKACRAANRAGAGQTVSQPAKPQENTANVTTTIPMDAAQTSKAPKRKTPFILGAIVIVVLLVIGAVVASHFLKSPEKAAAMANLTLQTVQESDEAAARI